MKEFNPHQILLLKKNGYFRSVYDYFVFEIIQNNKSVEINDCLSNLLCLSIVEIVITT